MEAVKNRQADAFSGLKKSAEREKYVAFSKPYIELRDVIVMRRDAASIAGLADLKQKRVGVVAGYWFEGVLKRSHRR